MPVIFRVRARVRRLWERGEPAAAGQMTSAMELDKATAASIGERIGEQPGTR